MPSALTFSLLLALHAPLGWCQLRQEVSLNGPWEYVRVTDLASGPPAEGWQPFRVPGMIDGVDYQRAWFRRDFDIPQAMAGLRIVLHFGGVKYNSRVRVNGQEVGGHFGGYEPFDVDITAVANVGRTNRLELGCHDWTGVFSDNTTDFSVMRQRPMEARDVPQDKVLAPIGGLCTQFGPWDDVKLQAHPAVYIRDLFIQPSVRHKRLRVEYTLANLTAEETSVRLRAVVDDQGKESLRLPEQQVTIPAGGETTLTVEAPWDSPRYWSHEDPYLYYLQTTLGRDGQTVDDLRTRFGFREFWVEGGRFYLNGSRINLLATSWWPEIGVTKDYIQRRIAAIKAANCRIFRTHTQPWPEIWYETADEMGLMMIPEGAVWNDDYAYRIDDPRFWDNYAQHLRAMVNRDKNKPSVVMYSLENEFYGGRMNERSPAMKDLIRLGELMHQWDPTRPIMYESDGDPGGVADVIGIHYPHEYPDFTQWPNTAYWLDKPKSLTWAFLDNAAQWLWDRQKPVYVGEFLWVPASDPSWDTVFFGDEAYTDYAGYHARAKGAAWTMAIQAYRYYEVGGISPWTMVEGGALDERTNPMYAAQQYAMQPIAAYIREYDHNFYAGDKVTRTADVYNDVLSPSRLTLRWVLMDGETELGAGTQTLDMQPAERREIQFTLTMPPADARREVSLKLSITRNGETVFEDAKPYSIFPALRLSAPAGATLGLYDPSGKTAALLARHGLSCTPVADLNAIPGGPHVLVVGAEALTGLGPPEPVIGQAGTSHGLLDFIRGGGRALVLEQTEYPRGVVPAVLTQHASTMTFPQVPDHPVLRGLRPGDLKWWRPDNMVTYPEPPRPDAGAFRAIVVSGSAQGIAHAPLLELPLGQGTLLLCQMKVAERLGVEPAAGILLQNALDYLASFAPQVARTALFCLEQATREYLDGLGLTYQDITTTLAQVDWASFDLLIACGPLDHLEPHLGELGAFVQRGGTLLLHNVSPDDGHLMGPLLGPGVTLAPYRGPVTRLPGAHPLSANFANEDLYWLGVSRAAYSWATRPRATDMTDCVLAKTLEGKQVVEYPHEVMTVEGTYTSNVGEAASLPTGGSYAQVTINVPASGPYILGVVAGGSQAEGIWPMASVTVDDKPFGEIACQKGEFDTYTTFGYLDAGPHEVRIRFVNDAYHPPLEDRNLAVKGLLLAPDDTAADVALLTSPAAVAVVQRGRGRVVLDNINWERAEQNATQATRYICGLLTGLGAQFGQSAATVLEAETFDHDPRMRWYRANATAAYLGDAGYIATKVRCAAPGLYTLRVMARGTAVRDIYPIIAVEVDGRQVGNISLTSANWRRYPITVKLDEGMREIKLIFTNDEWAPPEDRNLEVDRLEIVATQ